MTLEDVQKHPLTHRTKFRLSLNQKEHSTNTKKKHYITFTCEDCNETVVNVFQKNTWRFKCGKCSRGRKSTEQFISEAQKMHPHLMFDNTKYSNNCTKVAITCSVHGDFYVRPTDLLAGRGCPVCAARCRSQAVPDHLKETEATLYWVFFPLIKMYKLGITKDIQKRFLRAEEKGYTVIWQEQLPYLDAIKTEHTLKKHTCAYRYNGDQLLLQGGGSYELFNTNFFPTYVKVLEVLNETVS